MITGIKVLAFCVATLITQVDSVQPDLGTCFNKTNRKSIQNKMDNLITKISKESGCAKDSIHYEITEYFTGFYKKPCRHLPKIIAIKACGKSLIYESAALSGSLGDWLLGVWVPQNRK